MTNVCDTLNQNSSEYTIKAVRTLTEDEKNMIKQAIVVLCENGLNCMFIMTSGAKTYIPMDKKSKSGSGELLNINTLKLITLTKEGCRDIFRVTD